MVVSKVKYELIKKNVDENVGKVTIYYDSEDKDCSANVLCND